MSQYTSFNPFKKIKNNYQLAKMKTLSDALAYINDNLIKETQVDSYGNHEQNHTFIVFSDFSNKIKELPIDDAINCMPIFLPLSLIFFNKNDYLSINNHISGFDSFYHLDTTFSPECIDSFFKYYDHLNEQVVQTMWYYLFDQSGTLFLSYFLDICIKRWKEDNNPDYLLCYLDAYYCLFAQHETYDFQYWFDDYAEDVLRNDMENILILINENYPSFLGLELSIDNQKLIDSYHIAKSLNMTLLDALNNNKNPHLTIDTDIQIL